MRVRILDELPTIDRLSSGFGYSWISNALCPETRTRFCGNKESFLCCSIVGCRLEQKRIKRKYHLVHAKASAVVIKTRVRLSKARRVPSRHCRVPRSRLLWQMQTRAYPIQSTPFFTLVPYCTAVTECRLCYEARIARV